jgi:homocysteine S-methyltransferase
MSDIQKLMRTQTPFLTDGGFETWLFFVDGFEAPEFAAIVLMDDAKARSAMRRYFDRFLGIAERAGTGYVLDTNTWRGCPDWAPKLGLSRDDLMRLTVDAVSFAKDTRDAWAGRVPSILVNGVVGPAGDAYAPGRVPDATEAFRAHHPQIKVLCEQGVDMISALTMSNTSEAIGIARACDAHNMPVVISFTLETDGRLPTGQLLSEAIEQTDAETGAAPLYYMINCAHPDHFRDILAGEKKWVERIGGVRSNASRLSHAELDVAEELDDGNPTEFGALHAALAARLPNLRVVGGCCGTDHRHVGCVSDHLHHKAAA